MGLWRLTGRGWIRWMDGDRQEVERDGQRGRDAWRHRGTKPGAEGMREKNKDRVTDGERDRERKKETEGQTGLNTDKKTWDGGVGERERGRKGERERTKDKM